MKNLGIIIGVSTYANAPNLPACQRDADAVTALIQQSGRCSSILEITSDTNSANVKSQLAEFVKLHQGPDVGDVVFYFSGHGDFSGDDFSFVLSDFEQSKKNKTTLSNEELDSLVRSLNPKTFVKIVDACQSGITYIKEPESFDDYLKSSKGNFSNLYFMFSSKNDQFSYATKNLSHFTKALLETIVGRPDGAVRYKDVMDGIADSFSGSDGKQTPYFVVQAGLTEVLCDITPDLRESLAAFLSIPNSLPAGPEKQKNPTLLERVQEAAKDYVEAGVAVERLQELIALIKPEFLSSDVAELYDWSLNDNTGKVPNSSSIGSWIEQNPEDPKYFATATKNVRTVKRRVLKNRGAMSVFNSLRPLYGYDDDEEYKEVNIKEDYTDGYESTFTMPYSYLKIRLDPKYQSLTPEECYIVPIISPSHIRLFYSFAHFKKVDFDSAVRDNMSKWSTVSSLMKAKDQLAVLAKNIVEKFSDYVEEPIKSKYAVVQSANKPSQIMKVPPKVPKT